jgi:hypothetical protein
MMRTVVAKGAILGAAFGVLLPFGILLWTTLLEPSPGPSGEALWLALIRIAVAGRPTTLAVDALAPWLLQSTIAPILYVLLLVAVVVNWMLIGAIAGFTLAAIQRKRRSIP